MVLFTSEGDSLFGRTSGENLFDSNTLLSDVFLLVMLRSLWETVQFSLFWFEEAETGPG